MKTKTINLYTFDELTPEAQKKALDKYRDWNVNGWNTDSWADYMIEETFKEELTELGYINPKIMFSGFGSQGDGACFTCDDIDVAEVLRRLTNIKDEKTLLLNWGLLINNHKSEEVTMNIEHSGRYYHAHSTTLDISNNRDNDAVLETMVTEFYELCSKEIVELGNSLYKRLEKEYDELTSDEAIKEAWLDNEYYFTADGVLESNK
jgi:hypothetical protein